MRLYSPLDHFDYGELDNYCTCKICGAWRDRRSVFQQYQEMVESHVHNCNCKQCVATMPFRTAYLAALNKRDLYCEASWHASNLSPANPLFSVTVTHPASAMALGFMNWLETELTKGTESWWEIQGLKLPMDHWFGRFSRVVEASGALLGLGQRKQFAVAS